MNLYILNALLYVALFIFIYKGHLCGKWYVLPLVGLFAFSSICSILYYGTPLYYSLTERGTNQVSFEGLLYILINFIIFLIPLLKLNIAAQNLKHYDSIIKFAVFLGVVAIIPTFEILRLLLNTNVSDMADQYELNQTESVNVMTQLSIVARYCNSILTWFAYFTPVLLFYVISQKAKKYIILLAFLAFIEPVLGTLLRGGRGQLYMLIMLLVYNYFLFNNFFSDTVRKSIRKIGIFFSFVSVVLLISMTVARASSDTDLAMSQIYRYLGEGFVNFAETGYYSDKCSWGLSIFNGTGYTWMKDLGEYFQGRNWQYLTQYMGIRMYVYYTVFGDYFLDFGFIGGLVFNSFLAFVIYTLIVNKKAKLYIFLIVNLYARIGINGIYCYFYMNYMEFLLFSFLLVILLYLYERKKHY